MMEETLAKLLALETVSTKPENLKAAIDLVESVFEGDSDVFIEKYERNGKHSIVLSTKPGKKFKVILNGHMDVVPGDSEMFQPFVRNGKMYGRGASDMKGVDVAMIYAFKELVAAGDAVDCALMLTTDEEVGGFDGVGYLVDELGYECEAAFVPDTGRGDWSICTDEKGAWHVELTATGESAHGSRPWLGENAVDKLINTYLEIRDQFETRWGSPKSEEEWLPTLNLGAMVGGDATNIVPDKSVAKLDVRFPAQVGFAGVEDVVKSTCEANKVEYRTLVKAEPNHTDEGDKFISAWCQVLESHQIKPKFYKSSGGSDARFFSAKGSAVVMTKPVCSAIHGDEEWIDLKSLEQFKDAIKEWLTYDR